MLLFCFKIEERHSMVVNRIKGIIIEIAQTMEIDSGDEA